MKRFKLNPTLPPTESVERTTVRVMGLIRIKFHTQKSDWTDISAHCGEGHQAPPEALQKGPSLDRVHLPVLEYYDHKSRRSLLLRN